MIVNEPTVHKSLVHFSVPGHCCLPTEGLKCVSAAVSGHVREGHSVNQQIEPEPAESRGHRTVSRCCDNGLDAFSQSSGKVQYLQRQNLCL